VPRDGLRRRRPLRRSSRHLDCPLVATLHAEGAKDYECRGDTDGRLAWQFRKPVATRLAGGRTVGRHYAGLSWGLADGIATVQGRVSGWQPDAGANDIPWLRLEIVERRETVSGGQLASATVILRVNTAGWVAEGTCLAAGALHNVAYAADDMSPAPQPRN
jgi:hypothetical protein